MITNYKTFDELEKTIEKINKHEYSVNSNMFIDFLTISEIGVKLPTASYLVSDFEKASPTFKKAFLKYQNLVYQADSQDIALEGKSINLLLAEKRLRQLEKKEGIKRYSSTERSQYLENTEYIKSL